MRKKLFVLQTAGSTATLAVAYLVLQVPDSTAGYLLLSLALMYATLFLLSFTLAAVGGVLAADSPAPAGAGWSDLLRYGWRGWGRAAAVLLAASGVLYSFHRLQVLRLPVWVVVLLLALLVIPAAVRGASPPFSRIALRLLCAVLAVLLAFGAWKILSTPVELSRPWLELAYLGLRVVASFLLANLACALALAAGAIGFANGKK
jgi:hypothetical protein